MFPLYLFCGDILPNVLLLVKLNLFAWPRCVTVRTIRPFDLARTCARGGVCVGFEVVQHGSTQKPKNVSCQEAFTDVDKPQK